MRERFLQALAKENKKPERKQMAPDEIAAKWLAGCKAGAAKYAQKLKELFRE